MKVFHLVRGVKSFLHPPMHTLFPCPGVIKASFDAISEIIVSSTVPKREVNPIFDERIPVSHNALVIAKRTGCELVVYECVIALNNPKTLVHQPAQDIGLVKEVLVLLIKAADGE